MEGGVYRVGFAIAGCVLRDKASVLLLWILGGVWEVSEFKGFTGDFFVVLHRLLAL